MLSFRRNPLNLESLETRDAPAFLLSLAPAPAHLQVAQVAPPALTVVRATGEGLAATTVPLNWSASSLAGIVPLNWSAPSLAGTVVPLNWSSGRFTR